MWYLIKAHFHPRVIAVVCFYFKSLYRLNAWSDWLNVTHSIILNWQGEIICIFCTSTIVCHCKTDTELYLTAYVHPCSQELTFGATGIPQTCLSVLSSKPRECFLPRQRLKTDSLKRMDFKEPSNLGLPTRRCEKAAISSCTRRLQTTNFTNIHRIYTK